MSVEYTYYDNGDIETETLLVAGVYKKYVHYHPAYYYDDYIDQRNKDNKNRKQEK